MGIGLPKISMQQIWSARFFASLLMVMLCIQFVPLEGYGISPIKVGLMALSPLLLLIKVPYISKAMIYGLLYWFVCYFVASFHGNMRFSTIGYLGMFVVSYIVFYHLVCLNSIPFGKFVSLLKYLIIAYGAVLILQQIAMLLGIRNFPLINLNNQFFLSLTKLPSLSLEPSHSARLLSVMMLGYIRCIEMSSEKRVTLEVLFNKKHRIITILFLWSMLTMGSGTAFIGLGLLSIYFIQRKTLVYIIPLFALLFYIGQAMELSQMERAMRVAQVAMSGDVKAVQEEDGSAASRIIPIINTLKMDLTEKETWVGKGTVSHEYAASGWKRTTDKIAVVEQYGLIVFIITIILFYTCMCKSFLSLETLLFLILFGFSLANIAYTWGAVMIFTCVRYFQEQEEPLLLNDEENEY